MREPRIPMVSIDEVRIQGFTSLKDVRVKLTPVTALIGSNDTGKSNVLKALRLLSLLGTGSVADAIGSLGTWKECVFQGNEQARMGLATHGRIATSDWSGSYEYTLAIAVPPGRHAPEVEHEELTLGGLVSVCADHAREKLTSTLPVVTLVGGQTSHPLLSQGHGLWSGDPGLVRIVQAAVGELQQAHQGSDIYRLRPENLARAATPMSRPHVAPDGSNLAAALDALSSDPIHRPAFHRLQARLTEMIPYVSDVGVRLPEGQTGKVVRFVSTFGEKRYPFDAAQASDGLLLLLAYLLICEGPQSSPLLLLEEPENGVHVGRLAQILEMLRQVMPAESGQKVILTTHSPYLLDHLEKDEVQVVTRDASGASHITPMADFPDLEGWLKGFTLGEVWTNVGEEGLSKRG